MLARVTDIFGFSEDDFRRRWRFAAEGQKPWRFSASTPTFRLTNCAATGSAGARPPPRQLTADGMPEEFVAAANDRLARINAAYDAMARARGMATGAG